MISENLNYEKDCAVKIAKELRYRNEIVDKIKNAKTSYEIGRILCNARNNVK